MVMFRSFPGRLAGNWRMASLKARTMGLLMEMAGTSPCNSMKRRMALENSDRVLGAGLRSSFQASKRSESRSPFPLAWTACFLAGTMESGVV